MATKTERLIEYTITEFKKRWQNMHTLYQAGKTPKDIKNVSNFEAAFKKDQKHMAEEYYGPRHVEGIVSWSNEKVWEHLSLYLPHAIRSVLRDDSLCSSTSERRKHLKEMVYSEYVLIDPAVHSLYSKDIEAYELSECDFRGYPARVAYDDWYEFLGMTSSFSGILMKSTAEPFDDSDIDLLQESIYSDLKEDEPVKYTVDCHFYREHQTEMIVLRYYEIRKNKLPADHTLL